MKTMLKKLTAVMLALVMPVNGETIRTLRPDGGGMTEADKTAFRSKINVGNVTNTSDAQKAASGPLKDALDLKGNLLGGNTWGGTQTFGNITQSSGTFISNAGAVTIGNPTLWKAAFLLNAVDNISNKDWEQQNKIFRPEHYNATGDGVADDTSKVQQAIDAAELVGGVVVPSRWYGISDPGLLINKGWVSVFGFSHGGWFDDGESRCGFKPLTSTTKVLRLQSPGPGKTCRGIILQGFSIVGTQATTTTATNYGIISEYIGGYGVPTDCMVIDKVNVQWLRNGIYLEADDSPTVTNSRLCDNARALVFKNTVNPDASQCVIYDNREWGVKVQGSSYETVINGNRFGRDTWSIITENCQSVTITGNGFTRDNAVPVSTDGAIWLAYGETSSRVLISGNNFIQRSGQNLAYDWNVGVIKIDHTNNVSIVGNGIDYAVTQLPAISVLASDNVKIDANQFSRDTAFPLTVDGSSTRISIGDNQHYGLITLATQAALHAPRSDGYPLYADNSAAITGGLEVGQMYRTGTGEIRVMVEDTTAKAYADTVAATGKTVTAAQRLLLTQWINAEKAGNRWTPNKRYYLLGWGTAAANAVDVVTGTTLGTWQPNTAAFTFAAGYTNANGSTGYFDTGTNGAGYGLTNGDAGYTALIYNGGSASYGTIMGTGAGGNAALSLLKDTSGNIEFYGWYGGTLDMPGPTGIFTGTMVTGVPDRSKTYKFTTAGGHVVGADNNGGVGTMSTQNVEIWRRGTDTLYGNAQLGAVSVHANKTQAQIQASAVTLKTVWEGLFGLTLP